MEPTELLIHIFTGRHHQIRVQLANMGCPILGDTKYNPHSIWNVGKNGWQQIYLCAYKLTFRQDVYKRQVVQVSQATRLIGSCSINASRIASEI